MVDKKKKEAIARKKVRDNLKKRGIKVHGKASRGGQRSYPTLWGTRDTRKREMEGKVQIPLSKDVAIRPKIGKRVMGDRDVIERSKGIGLKVGDYDIDYSQLKTDSPWFEKPTKRQVEFAIKNLYGGNLGGSVSKQGKDKEIQARYTIPIGKIPILREIFGYKRQSGGRISTPKGVGAAINGYGRAMK